MRGRQTYAALQKLDVPELIAESREDYVARAIRLGRDVAARSALVKRLESARNIIENDVDARRDVIHFFRNPRASA
ncbi:MAG: hypothetical protein IPK97_06475 [Ahniella sp.]|nr:hypothetical protein [Ahniella sp.]